MSLYNRRQVLRAALGATAAGLAARRAPAQANAAPMIVPAAPLRLDASAPPPAPRTDVLHLGAARTPQGRSLGADSRNLLRDGTPWLPVMGEFHYARYPEAEWDDALRRMKSGGVDVVATYVFWIHHEETQGQWDWTGRRNLRGFLQAVQRAGMTTLVRCGPWCHGEVRNGGFPDWLQADARAQGYKTRTADPRFLAHVQLLYAQIAAQTQGLLWKNGGPVLGIQCDNEYRGPAAYLLALKALARDAGMDVPLYTRTGWPALSTPAPPGELLPLFGAYAEGFWDRVLTPMPGAYGDAFLFLPSRGAASGMIGTDQLGKPKAPAGDDSGAYPYCCCEIGGGMMSSYHRRIRIAPTDVLATGLVKIGSGNNLQGYYMYHGGVNPEGRLSTLEESQDIGGYNDLPVKTYDFQAPVGEFGQLRPHYHLLRRMHLFLRDWGPALATMPAHSPLVMPADAKDNATMRWTARTDGTSGFVFVNNAQRLQSMPAKPGVRFQIDLPGGTHTLPDAPVTVPADTSFFWPFNLDLGGGATLAHATAQPVCRLADAGTEFFVFAQTPGVPTEFAFEGNLTLTAPNGVVSHDGSRVRVADVKPGTGAAVLLESGGRKIALILLSDAQSRACWKGTLAGRERVFLTDADLTFEADGTLGLRADHPAALAVSVLPAALAVSVLPAPASLSLGGHTLAPAADGLFRRFHAPALKAEPLQAALEPTHTPGPARQIPLGPQHVAMQPTDADFDAAGVWRIRLPAGTDPTRDLLLRIRYAGDVARLYVNGKFVDDNFYNGTAFEFGLKRYPDALRGELLLKILPLRKDAPIYLSRETWDSPDPRPDFGNADSLCRLLGVDVVERHAVSLHCG